MKYCFIESECFRGGKIKVGRVCFWIEYGEVF